MKQFLDIVRNVVDTYFIPYSTELRNIWLGLAIAAYGTLSMGLMTASYGRHYSENSIIPSVNGKLGWMIMEIISPISVSILFHIYAVPGPAISTGGVLLALWLLHYSNRAIFSVVMSPGMKSSRVDTVLYAAFFNLINASWVGHDLGLLNSKEFLITPKTIAGFGLFISGMVINISSDYYLQSLRRKKGKSGGGEYVLPDWGLYKYIVSPNYAGELLGWWGFALLLEMQSGWTFLVWTFCNLVPRARSNLHWYRAKFGAKVGNRKSIIPGAY